MVNLLTGSHGGHVRVSTSDRDEAEAWLTALFRPVRIDVGKDSTPLEMNLVATRFASLTVGRVSFGRGVVLKAEEATNFHVNVTLQGNASSRTGHGPPLVTRPGEAAVFGPSAPGEITCSPGCVQLCLMMPRSVVELELELLLGHGLNRRPDFEFGMTAAGALGKVWRRAIRLLQLEVSDPSGLADHATAALHMEGLIVDALLLGHKHNYTELIQRPGGASYANAVRRAVELIDSDPSAAWSVASVASEVHTSVRTLQEGFLREIGIPPMRYLRLVRLRRARRDLQIGSRETTTVSAVAKKWGFFHLGRFAAAYNEEFSELPSTTLHSRP